MSYNKDKSREWTITAKDASLPLRDFISNSLSISRRAAKQILDSRKVWVNQRCVWMAHHKLKRGDTVRCIAAPDPRKKPPATVASRKLTIIFQDSDFIVVDKPAGITTNASAHSVEELLRKQLNEPDIQVVHRLDKATSGCLLCARGKAAFEAAVEVFREHSISKSYRTIVHGRWSAEATTVDLPIEGQRALTNIACLKANNVASHLLVRIETGRTHQIRKHLAMARHPVIGDRHYGPKLVTNPLFQEVPYSLLHAVELQLDHPTKSGEIRVFAPLTPTFHKWLKAFKLS